VLPLAVIARKRYLRPRQSPIRQGDGFTEFTGSAVKMLIMMIVSYNTVAYHDDRFIQHSYNTVAIAPDS